MSQERDTKHVGSKLCHIVKRPDFDGYGFNLHSEKIKPGQFIGKVDANSPASEAGLKEGDRIIEVNGVPIECETHKQVVQRIKAVANEVRLLLIDVAAYTKNDGDVMTTAVVYNDLATPPLTTSASHSGQQDYRGSVQEIPGVSPNISTISLISTKRMSGSSGGSGAVAVPVTPPIVPHDAEISVDVTDKGIRNENDVVKACDMKDFKQQHNNHIRMSSNNKNSIPSTPSTTTVATVTQALTGSNDNGNVSGIASGNGNASANGESCSNNNKKVGSLQLPMTAAEMRAKLLSKKKYDPKNENVDLKKKFEIIQKL